MKTKTLKYLFIALITVVALLAMLSPVSANTSTSRSLVLKGSSEILTHSRTLTAEITDNSLSNKGVIWTTSNPSMIKLSNSMGENVTITAVGNGGATITAKSAANGAIKASITIMSDIGQPVSNLPAGSLIVESGIVYRLVDKSQPYGKGYSAISGFNAPSFNYLTLMIENSFVDSNWSNSPVNAYSESSLGRSLNGAKILSGKMGERLVGVRYEYLHRQDAKSLFSTMFLPSLNELGYRYTGIDRPVREGKVFLAFKEEHYPNTSMWTRTQVRSAKDLHDKSKAIQFVSSNVAVVDEVTAYSRLRPVINVTPEFKVSYYKNKNGYYPVR